MAKISPVSIKYMIYAKFVAEGRVEQPDVVGAIFGQTEGLLGTDLEMRDLQREGKIGRIEVHIENMDSRTSGRIDVPSALDKTETTLVAAAMETIERVGPSTVKIEIEKIEDVRESKRSYILERAKKLLGKIEDEMPKSKEIAQNIREESRADKLKEYGNDKLPAGNLEGDEIIVVEGRADVLNLLRNGVENVIGMDGTKLPETIKKLSYEKKIILFLDGDRGGRLIAKNVIGNAKVHSIAYAPDGKEVEELTGKEILYSLRKTSPVHAFARRREEEEKSDNKLEVSEQEKLKKFLSEVENTKSALILNERIEIIGRAGIKSLLAALNKTGKEAYAVIVDTATPAIVAIAEKTGVKNLAAKNFSITRDTAVNLISI